MESEPEGDQGKMYKSVAKGLQVLRNGLRNIASAPERHLLTKYRAPVSAKYSITSSRIPSQSEPSVTIAALGHGFPNIPIQPRQDLLSQEDISIRSSTVRNHATASSEIIHTAGKLYEPKHVYSKLGLASIKDSIILKKFQPKREPSRIPELAKLVSTTVADASDKSNTTGSRRELSIHSDSVLSNHSESLLPKSTPAHVHEERDINKIIASTETVSFRSDYTQAKSVSGTICLSTSQREATGTSNITGYRKELAIHSNFEVFKLNRPPEKEAKDIKSHNTSVNAATEDSESVFTKPASPYAKEDFNEDILSSESLSENPNFALAKSISDICCIIEATQVSTSDSESTLPRPDAPHMHDKDDLPKGLETPVHSPRILESALGKDISLPAHDLRNDLKGFEYATPSDVSKIALPKDISSPAQCARDNRNDLDHTVPSETQSPKVTSCVNKVDIKSCSESAPQMVEAPVTATISRRRPRPRRSNLNTDRKMWMSKKSAELQKEKDIKTQCHTMQKHELVEKCSAPEDMLIKLFGYDPSDDAFSNTRTEKRHPTSLTDVKVTFFNRQEIHFSKDDEDEFSIVSEGASCILYLATKDGKDVLVKDFSKSSRSANDVLREARILSILNETTVTPRLHGVLEHGLLEKEYSIIYEKCEGFLTLTQLMKSGYYLSRSDWTKISLSLAAHMKTLHSHEVLHNNLCLDNILVNKDSLEVKLVGFSQASYREGVKLSRAARQHHGVSPEVKYGCITSPYSDVYALGSVLEQVMVESRVMALHEVVLHNHQDLPRDRPQAETVFSIIKDIFDKTVINLRD